MTYIVSSGALNSTHSLEARPGSLGIVDNQHALGQDAHISIQALFSNCHFFFE